MWTFAVRSCEEAIQYRKGTGTEMTHWCVGTQRTTWSIGNTKPLFTPSSGASQHPASANPVPRGATPQPRRSTNWAALQAASMDGSAVRALGATARGGGSLLAAGPHHRPLGGGNVRLGNSSAWMPRHRTRNSGGGRRIIRCAGVRMAPSPRQPDGRHHPAGPQARCHETEHQGQGLVLSP